MEFYPGQKRISAFRLLPTWVYKYELNRKSINIGDVFSLLPSPNNEGKLFKDEIHEDADKCIKEIQYVIAESFNALTNHNLKGKNESSAKSLICDLLENEDYPNHDDEIPVDAIVKLGLKISKPSKKMEKAFKLFENYNSIISKYFREEGEGQPHNISKVLIHSKSQILYVFYDAINCDSK